MATQSGRILIADSRRDLLDREANVEQRRSSSSGSTVHFKWCRHVARVWWIDTIDWDLALRVDEDA
jgi:hypothetical protein